MAEVVAACAERAMVADAWAVYFHRDDEPRDAVSQSYVRNAYGDVYPVALCPAAPDSRRYAEELTAEISRYGARVLLAEAMHFLPLAHGAHHERYFGRLAPLAQFLLSLCFCEHCVGAAESVGVDAARLGSWVRGVVDDPPRVDSHRLVGVAEELAASALAADDLRRFLDLREQHVRLVVERSAAVAARHDVQFCFVDPSPALASRPRGVDRATCLDDCSRELGVRLSEIANVCRVVPALYATEVEAFADDLDATDLRIGTRPRAVLLRPMPPDCDALPNLRAKIGLLEKRGVEDVFYYHYGLMDHRDTARLRAAHGR